MQRKLEHPCPGCGSYARINQNGQSVCAYCGNALAPLPFTHPGGRLTNATPLRIGMRAKMNGKEFVAVGRIAYEERDDDEVSTWEEWVLLSQDGEARYLEYDEGKWNLSQYWPQGPEDFLPGSAQEGATVLLNGSAAACFSAGVARITGLEGEIPWPVSVGSPLRYADFRQGETIFSVEWSDEVEWFRGRRLDDAEVFTYFGLTQLAQAQETLDVVRKDRAGFGCLLMLLSIACLIGWGVALNQHGVGVVENPVVASALPEEGARFGPIALGPGGKVHRLWLSTSGLKETSLAAQAILEDESGEVMDADAEFWDESGYDDGYWHEWVTESFQDFRVQRAGNYFVRLRADAETAAVNAPVRFRVERNVLYPVYLAWFGFVAGPLGFIWMVSGGSNQKVWKGMATR